MHEAEWKPFAIGDLFFIVSGEDMDKRSMVPGNTPFVGSASTGNGVTAFTGAVNGSLDRLFLGVNRNGSVGEAFVHPYKCLCSGDVRRLHLQNGRDGESIFQFCAVAVRKQKEKYSYGCKFGTERMRRQKILLPVAGDGSPDWDFMDACVKSVKKRLLARWKRRAEDRLAGLEEREIPRLEEKAWKAFAIGDLFSISSGAGPGKRDMQPGDIPFVGASAFGIGVTAFAGNAGAEPGGVLGVNANGSIGEAFVHPYAALFSGDVKRLRLKNGMAGEAVLLFCAQAVLKQKEKYSYGCKFSAERMRRQEIMLPVDGAGEPDWDYMEQYVKNLMAKKLRQFLAFLEPKSRAKVTLCYEEGYRPSM